MVRARRPARVATVVVDGVLSVLSVASLTFAANIPAGGGGEFSDRPTFDALTKPTEPSLPVPTILEFFENGLMGH